MSEDEEGSAEIWRGAWETLSRNFIEVQSEKAALESAAIRYRHTIASLTQVTSRH